MQSPTHSDALRFLQGLHSYLDGSLPPATEIRESIPRIVTQARASTDDRHKAFPEAAFLNEYVAPLVNTFLRDKIGLSAADAKRALLSESYKSIREIASGSPARSQSHPFRKALGTSPQNIIEQWKGRGPGNPLVQSCPDLALRYTCPVKVVVEGKYFSQGGKGAAATALATDIYQSFFYLALSKVAETRSHPAWDYDHSCLFAYDASKDGSLVHAWIELDPKVRDGIWNGANIYVMVIATRRSSVCIPIQAGVPHHVWPYWQVSGRSRPTRTPRGNPARRHPFDARLLQLHSCG
jgi:hypothetical protein